MIFESNNETPFSKEEAIDLMVSLSAIDTNSEKSGEVSITLYRKQNFRMNGMSIGELEFSQLSSNQINSHQSIMLFSSTKSTN